MTQQNATFGGFRTPAGAMTPISNSAEIFVQCTYTPKFHHPMFTRSEVIVLTHKPANTPTNSQRDAAENIQRSSLRYDVG